MKRIFTTLIITISIFGCNDNKFDLKYSDESEILGLASPIDLNIDTTSVFLTDFFNNVEKIDSITCEKNENISLSDNNEILTIISNNDLPKLINISCWINGIPYSLLAKKSEKEKVKLSFNPKGKKFKTVQFAGEMNGWNPSSGNMKNLGNIWQAEFLLNPGTYQYQFVVDENWILDPNNPDSIDNNVGGFNSLLIVGEKNIDKTPILFTEKVLKRKVKIGYKNQVENFMIFWQNFKLPPDFYNVNDNNVLINIPEQAKELERSYIRVWAFNKIGISNDILIPLKNGEVILKAETLNRFDHHSNILYNAFVDRFYNGDTKNDEPVDDPEILPPANYLGGDIVGITQKIKDGYFNDLGINTIWVSPLVQNPKDAFGLWPEPRTKFSGYHGYWPVSFTKIDYRYGTSNELKELVETAHQHGLNVLLDFVANHVHQEHPVYQEHNDWATNLYLPDGSLNTEKWDEHRLTTWFDVFLPTLDLSKPEVVEMLTDSAVFWLEEYNLDGFRHDATKHIPEIFWRTLTKKIKNQIIIPQNKILYQIGETYGNPELISSYVNSGELNAQFDFNVYDDAIAVFARDNESFNRLNTSLEESFKYYGNHNLMGYITGNQDRPRFISLAGGDLSFNEDSKLAGWTREIGVGNPVGYKKLSSLTAFLMTIPGVPVIYFGDEIGDPGGNDPDNRRMMRFENLKKEEKKVKDIATKLIKIRKNNLEFIFGDFETLFVSENNYAFARTYFTDISVVVFNNSNNEKSVTIKIPERFEKTNFKTNFNSEFTFSGTELNVKLPANSFEIISSK
ncbi:MAG: hypothetical protein JEY97_07550 [Bacteroidales bacterium]|nr:hypothetical protein [Bacteroidales bacterium]